jgi:hypothetical protein
MSEESLTLTQWCAKRKVSKPMHYKLKSQGKAVRTHYVGSKVLVSDEADMEWVREREAEAEMLLSSEATEAA